MCPTANDVIYKSHIKKGFQSCEVAVHYNTASAEPNSHLWKPESIDETLPREISITLIDRVCPEVWDNPDTLFDKLVKKEKYWQNQLNTITEGLNSRNERNIRQVRVSKKWGISFFTRLSLPSSCLFKLFIYLFKLFKLLLYIPRPCSYLFFHAPLLV